MTALRITTGTVEPIQILAADVLGAPLPGKTDLFVRVRRDSDGFYLDWADLVFKAAGWTTRDQLLTEQDAVLAPGLYAVTGGLDTATFTDDPDLLIISLQTPGTDAVLPTPAELKVGQYVDDIPTTLAHADFAAYNDGQYVAVNFDSTAANTNTVVGVDGTPDNPVSTEAAVISLLASLNIRTVAIQLGTRTLTGAGTWTDSVFYTCAQGLFGAVALNGQSVNASCFHDLIVTGAMVSGDIVFARDCVAFDLLNVSGDFWRCRVGDMTPAGFLVFKNCSASTPTSNPPVITLGAGLQTIAIQDWNGGGLNIGGMANIDSEVDIDMVSGELDLLASNTAGTIIVRGMIGKYTDDATAADATVIDLRGDERLRYVHKAFGGEPLQTATHTRAVIGTPGSISTPDGVVDQVVTQVNANVATFRQQ